MKIINIRSLVLSYIFGGSSLFAVTAPILNPQSGDSFTVFPVVISSPDEGAEIHYTLNGAEPTLYDPLIASGGAITINRNWTLRAKSWVGGVASASATADYRLTGDISAGASHSLALGYTGNVSAWGLQTNGRLGNLSSATANVSLPVASRFADGAATDATMVAAGATHSVLLRNGGTVWATGLNNTGQLGDNTTTQRTAAVQVRNSAQVGDYLTGCVAVAAGDGFSAALSSGGEVFAWGSKSYGALGDGTTSGTRLFAGKVYSGPTGTTPLAGIGRIAVGGSSCLGLDLSAGTVWAWGDNSRGQLGQGNTTSLSRAAKMKLNATTFLSDVLDVAVGADHAAVLRWKTGDPALQGRVFCSGQQQYGRLGNRLTSSANISYPVQVVQYGGVPLEGIVSIAAGAAHTLALDSNGNVWAWGHNPYGALGDNTIASRGYAVKVKNPAGTGDLSGIVRIAAGGTGLAGHSIAVAGDGTVYTWGYNANGQLGIGSASSTPVKLPVAVGANLSLLPKPPEVTITANVTQSFSPGSAILTASPTDPDNNITKVEFFRQGVLVGEVTAPPWRLILNDIPSGNHHIYAKVSDASGLVGYSLSQQLNIVQSSAPTVTLSANVTKSDFPGAVTLTASPADADNNIRRVDYYNNGNWVGRATSAPWQIQVSGLAASNYLATAVVIDSTDLKGTSVSIPYSISGGNGGPPIPLVDTDGDGLSDAWELMIIFDSADPDSMTLADITANGDNDGDGLANWIEYQNGLSGHQADSDGDGYGDRLSVDQKLHLKLDESAGTGAADTSDKSHHGILLGSPSWEPTAGVYGGAISFDSTDDALVLPKEILDGAADLTVSLWFKTSAASAVQTLLSASSAAQPAGPAIYIDNGNSIRFTASSGNSVTWNVGRNLTDDLWHHVILVMDQGNSKASLLLDGVAFGIAQSISLTVNTVDTLTLGQRRNADTTFDSSKSFNGLIDEVRIWAAVIKDPNLAELFQINDLDRDGLPDDWEISLNGNLSTLAAGDDDLDGDGASNRREFEDGTDPDDYYNGSNPVVSLFSGSGQTIYNGERTGAPLVFLVTDGTAPLVNAPLELSHLEMIGGIETLDGDTLATTLTLRTNSEGKVTVHFKAD
ncbi:MAG: LamG-like jellyroll fold domain-containing protein [Verrucomicrobiota bacterium]